MDAAINGLLTVTGRAPLFGAEVQPGVQFEPARARGAVWAPHELRKALGFFELRRVFRGTRYQIDVEASVRVMVFNRLCDPDSTCIVPLATARTPVLRADPAQPLPLGPAAHQLAH